MTTPNTLPAGGWTMRALSGEPLAGPGPMPGAVTGGVAATLRLEGGVALILAVVAYHLLGASWWMFAVLFLAPDLSMLGYLANRRVGALAYNTGHSYLTPAAVALVGVVTHSPAPYPLAAIWFAHIGFDRLLGYGLKYPQAFGATHLGLVGRSRQAALTPVGKRRLQPRRAHPIPSSWPC